MRNLLLLAALAVATSAHAQQPAAPPSCADPAYRQLDFWVGDWDLDVGSGAHGTNHITRNEVGDCVIAEHFSGAGFTGASYSAYDRADGVWRQTWVDSQGGVLELAGGPVQGQPYIFELKTTGPRGPDKALKRMIWQEVSADALTWRWQTLLPDGGWKDVWVINYRRKKS